MATDEQIALLQSLRDSKILKSSLRSIRMGSGKKLLSHIHWIALELAAPESSESQFYHLTLGRYQIDKTSGNLHYLPGELQLVRVNPELRPHGPGLRKDSGLITLDPRVYYPDLLSNARPAEALSLPIEVALSDPGRLEDFIGKGYGALQ